MAASGTDRDRILAVYRETVDPLYAYVSRCTGGDRALAEDVTQEAWLRAVREWQRRGPPERPLAWLVTVARNLLASYYRRRRPSQLDSALADEALAAVEPGGDTTPADTAAVVGAALARLPAAEAQLLEAFHFEDRRITQIAESRGISERAVEGRLRRARLRLRRELQSILGVRGERR